MKVGDLVRYAPRRGYAHSTSKIGVIVDLVRIDARGSKYFKVLYCEGTIGNDVWDYDLRIIKSA